MCFPANDSSSEPTWYKEVRIIRKKNPKAQCLSLCISTKAGIAVQTIQESYSSLDISRICKFTAHTLSLIILKNKVKK